MAPFTSSLTYNDPSGPCAKPHGLAFAFLVLNTLSVPLKPSAKTSQGPDGLPFLKGTNTT